MFFGMGRDPGPHRCLEREVDETGNKRRQRGSSARVANDLAQRRSPVHRYPTAEHAAVTLAIVERFRQDATEGVNPKPAEDVMTIVAFPMPDITIGHPDEVVSGEPHANTSSGLLRNRSQLMGTIPASPNRDADRVRSGGS